MRQWEVSETEAVSDLKGEKSEIVNESESEL